MPINITSFVAALISDVLCELVPNGKLVEAEISIGDAERSVYLIIDKTNREGMLQGIELAKRQVKEAKAKKEATPVPAGGLFDGVRIVQVNQGE